MEKLCAMCYNKYDTLLMNRRKGKGMKTSYNNLWKMLAYLVYHKKVDGAYHTFLLLAHAHLRAVRAELGSGHVRGERQLEERVHRHSASIEGGYACGRHDDGTLRCMFLQIAQEGGLARPCPTGEKKTRTGGLYYVPRQLCFLVHDVLCFLRQAQSYAK